jgi:hypothetical protein
VQVGQLIQKPKLGTLAVDGWFGVNFPSCRPREAKQTHMVISTSGRVLMLSAESRAFSTSSRMAVNNIYYVLITLLYILKDYINIII